MWPDEKVWWSYFCMIIRFFITAAWIESSQNHDSFCVGNHVYISLLWGDESLMQKQVFQQALLTNAASEARHSNPLSFKLPNMSLWKKENKSTIEKWKTLFLYQVFWFSLRLIAKSFLKDFHCNQHLGCQFGMQTKSDP